MRTNFREITPAISTQRKVSVKELRNKLLLQRQIREISCKQGFFCKFYFVFLENILCDKLAAFRLTEFLEQADSLPTIQF